MRGASGWVVALAVATGCLAGTAAAEKPAGGEAAEFVWPQASDRVPTQAFYENLWIQTVGPSITFNCTGFSGCTPDRRMDISNNGHGFFVTEPGPEGILLQLLASWSEGRHAYVKSPLSIGASWVLSPHYGSALSVYGEGDGRLTVEDYGSPAVGRNLLRMINNGPATFRFENRASGAVWGFGSIVAEDKFFITKSGAQGLDLTLDGAGNLAILGTLTQLSDRNAKQDLREVDGPELLRKVAALPLSSWAYKADPGAARHLGPMAQDFSAAFGLGPDDRHVAPSDVAGVSLAAVQALQRDLGARLAEKDAQIAALAERLAALEAAAGRDAVQ